jgi:hypothetical protein
MINTKISPAALYVIPPFTPQPHKIDVWWYVKRTLRCQVIRSTKKFGNPCLKIILTTVVAIYSYYYNDILLEPSSLLLLLFTTVVFGFT